MDPKTDPTFYIHVDLDSNVTQLLKHIQQNKICKFLFLSLSIKNFKDRYKNKIFTFHRLLFTKVFNLSSLFLILNNIGSNKISDLDPQFNSKKSSWQ